MRYTEAEDKDVIIIGAGLSGLACAHRLIENNVTFTLLEGQDRIGGRLKTERIDGFTLNHGFQVLQTAYSEAQRLLDYKRLKLHRFAPGAIIRIAGNFFRVSDPIRRPSDLWSTLKAPIGSTADRLRIIWLTRKVRTSSVTSIFRSPDMPTIDFLRTEGFSENIIQRFFKPFFAGVCLDPDITASSRVFRHIYRVFAEGDVSLPNDGMEAIAQQLAEFLPKEKIRTGAKVESIAAREVVLTTGEKVKGMAVVIATEGPETARLLGQDVSVASRGEWCLYFSAETVPIAEPYLILNGEGNGWVNSLTVPSVVVPSYAPSGSHLVSVVVIGHLHESAATIENIVRRELSGWFGPVVGDWCHIKTQRIVHALPEQSPPMPDPINRSASVKSGIYVCGEYQNVPGIQWALLSGYQAAEQVKRDLDRNGH